MWINEKFFEIMVKNREEKLFFTSLKKLFVDKRFAELTLNPQNTNDSSEVKSKYIKWYYEKENLEICLRKKGYWKLNDIIEDKTEEERKNNYKIYNLSDYRKI